MSKNNEIRVDVIGVAGSGKSTVIAVIAQALEEMGLDHKVFAVDEDHLGFWSDIEQRADELAEKGTVVKIHEVQTARDW